MNKTKISFMAAFTALIISFTNQVAAQEKPVTLGVRGGVNLSTFGGYLKSTNAVLRYQFGITADIALTDNIYILTGLDFQTKGTKYSPESEPDVKYNPMYLQVPVNIGYKFNIASNTRLILNAGPYAAYGLGGKAKSGDDKVSVFGDNKFKRFDYGLTAGVGMELWKIAIHAGYDLGLANINHSKETKVRNRNPFLTIGYKF